jgi:predicted aminopeptidase
MLRRVLAGGIVLCLAGCQAGYYVHLLRGQYDVLSKREPIANLVAAADTDPELKLRLERALDARRFASRELGLPENGSYTDYADLGRSFVLWNVFATPEFSLAPREWCHLLVGCLSYRGYYNQAGAQEAAAELRNQGDDVYVAGVPAYSTLGWFDDPLLNSMLHWSDDVLAGTIFHELAHQQLFVKGDTAFNESFASFVEEQGLRQYLRNQPELAREAWQKREREVQFINQVMETRRRLEAIYGGALSDADKRRAKQAEFERLRVEYAVLKQEKWGGQGYYDAWMAEEFNNAKLLPFGLYHQWVPAFAALFRKAGNDWAGFYRAAAALSELEPAVRLARLEELRKSS